ncbi:TrkA-N domain-containing protein [Candidatus Electrothrix marina]|uniref:TrkA-N domain-containing protein n=1 Tax=Candidatus Electrothrix marina TaxID=1859130 RepID=A0A444JHK5_9BACT|nr:TrkA-N domain-containing protein [Candidatus Electrothrix marina]
MIFSNAVRLYSLDDEMTDSRKRIAILRFPVIKYGYPGRTGPAFNHREKDKDVVKQIMRQGGKECLLGDAADIDVLRRAGIEKAGTVLALQREKEQIIMPAPATEPCRNDRIVLIGTDEEEQDFWDVAMME